MVDDREVEIAEDGCMKIRKSTIDSIVGDSSVVVDVDDPPWYNIRIILLMILLAATLFCTGGFVVLIVEGYRGLLHFLSLGVWVIAVASMFSWYFLKMFFRVYVKSRIFTSNAIFVYNHLTRNVVEFKTDRLTYNIPCEFDVYFNRIADRAGWEIYSIKQYRRE